MSKSKKKRPYTGRDYNMVGIIKGANKAYIEEDQKKKANKMASRQVDWDKEMQEAWADLEGAKINCFQCGLPFDSKDVKDKDEQHAMDLGYCSKSCLDCQNNKGK